VAVSRWLRLSGWLQLQCHAPEGTRSPSMAAIHSPLGSCCTSMWWVRSLQAQQAVLARWPALAAGLNATATRYSGNDIPLRCATLFLACNAGRQEGAGRQKGPGRHLFQAGFRWPLSPLILCSTGCCSNSVGDSFVTSKATSCRVAR
jgi:hypothetical protein